MSPKTAQRFWDNDMHKKQNLKRVAKGRSSATRFSLGAALLKMKNRIILWGAASLILACLVAASGFLYFHTFSPDRSSYPVRGIDVSHHQGRIDWRRVAADDVA